MKNATILLIQADLIELLKAKGIITSADEFATPTEAQIADLIPAVVNVLETHGLVLPEKVKRAIAAVPLVLQIAQG